MGKLDEQEKLIVRELIKNPRTSDNKISKITGVPLKTVNRKRKLLEENDIISYYVDLKCWIDGTSVFNARQMFLIQFRHDITRQQFKDAIINPENIFSMPQMHILHSFLGEHDGHLTLVLLMESRHETDLLEIFNADIVPVFKSHFGDNCIQKTKVINITSPISLFHNYYPDINMDKGTIKDDWPDDKIFVG